MIRRFKLDLFAPEIVVVVAELDKAVEVLKELNDPGLTFLAEELKTCERYQGVRIHASNNEHNYLLIWVAPDSNADNFKATVLHECVHAGMSLFKYHGQDVESAEEIFAMTVEKLFKMIIVRVDNMGGIIP